MLLHNLTKNFVSCKAFYKCKPKFLKLWSLYTLTQGCKNAVAYLHHAIKNLEGANVFFTFYTSCTCVR